MNRKKHSFHSTLLVALLCMALVPLMLGTVVMLGAQGRFIFQTIETDLESKTTSIADLIDDSIADSETLLKQIAVNPSAGEFFSRRAAETDDVLTTSLYSFLYSIKKQNPSIEITCSKLDGGMISTGESNPDYNLAANKDWGILRQALHTAEPVVYCHDWRYTSSRKLFVSVGLVHLDDGGEPDGVMIIDLMASLLERYLDDSSDGFSLAALDSLGIFCYQSANWTYSSDKIHYAETKMSLPSGISILARMPLTMMNSILKSTRDTFLILIALSIVCSVFVSLFISRRISRPISKLAECIEQISAGNFKAKSNIRSGVLEFDSICKDIDTTGKKIENLIEINKEKEKSLRHSMLKSLEAEVHPHFIFNCLGIIQQAIKLDDKTSAMDMVNQLAKLLRSGLNETNIVPLRTEIETVRSYLSLQSYRFGKRLEYTIDFDDWILDSCSTPKMAIQTLVENAIVHNIDRIDRVLSIVVHGSFYKSSLTILVEDNGIGIPQQIIDNLHSSDSGKSISADGYHGHGLQNANQRLKLFYGPGCGLELRNNPGGGVSIKMTLLQEVLIE